MVLGAHLDGGGCSHFFDFHPETLGKIPILTDIVQMDWFKNQLAASYYLFVSDELTDLEVS